MCCWLNNAGMSSKPRRIPSTFSIPAASTNLKRKSPVISGHFLFDLLKITLSKRFPTKKKSLDMVLGIKDYLKATGNGTLFRILGKYGPYQEKDITPSERTFNVPHLTKHVI